MLTPIDYGKNFLQTLYNERNADGAAGYLADDLVWVTPDEILFCAFRCRTIRSYTTSI